MTGSKTSRCTALYSFYDEPIDMIAASVAALGGVVDHLVAVDGAYMLFPDGKAHSDPQTVKVIEEICRGLRIGFTVHIPSHVWSGNEVQKRNHMVRLAEPVTREDGWYFAVDADVVVTNVAFDWFEQLEKIAADDWGAIEIAVRERRTLPAGVQYPEDPYSNVRLFYRALPGLTYGPAHWVIHAPDPETGEPLCLWGPHEYSPCGAFDAGHLLKVDHRFERSEERTVNARKYYARREQVGVERQRGAFLDSRDGFKLPE